MKNNLKTILFFFIFLTLFSFTTYADEQSIGFGDIITVFVIKVPTWSSITNYTPPSYDPITPSQFNITWENANSAFITIMNDSYILVSNQSMSNVSNIYNYSLILPVGSWKWISYANDSSNRWNSSDNFTFNIIKSLSSSYIFFNTNSVGEGTQTNATCLKSSGDSSSLVRLARNGTAVGTPSLYSTSEVATLSAGNWIYTCTVDDSQNYSNSSASSQTLIIIAGTFTPSGGSSNTLGSSSSGQSSSGSFTVTPSTSNVTMESNSTSIVFKLANTFPSDITSVNVSASGINSSWYTLDKTSITRLQHDVGTDTVTMSINIPVNAVAGTYTILLTATGRDFNLNTITRQASVTMTIPQEENPESATNESEQLLNTTSGGIGSIFTGFSIKFQNFTDYIPLIILAVVVIAIIIFRDEVMEFVTRGKVKSPERKPEAKEHAEAKKHNFAVMDKIRSLRQRRLVVQFKKIEPEKEKKT